MQLIGRYCFLGMKRSFKLFNGACHRYALDWPPFYIANTSSKWTSFLCPSPQSPKAFSFRPHISFRYSTYWQQTPMNAVTICDAYRTQTRFWASLSRSVQHIQRYNELFSGASTALCFHTLHFALFYTLLIMCNRSYYIHTSTYFSKASCETFKKGTVLMWPPQLINNQ